MGASLETSAFASAVRLWTSCLWKRSEPRVSISSAEAGWILHWSNTASVNPASKHGPDLFSLFVTLRPSTVDDKGQIQRDLSQYRVLVGPRHDGRLADWGLADRHLADWSLLIDGLSAREVGSARGSHHGSYHGKRCSSDNHNFRHGTSP